MVQLGFNTGISGVTKPTQVVSESKKPIPAPIKPPFPSNKPRIVSTSMIGLVNPKREDERVVTNAAYEIAKAKKLGSGFDSIMEKYYGTMTDEGFADARFIASDLLAGSGADEMAEAYKSKGFSPEEIKDIHLGFSYINGDGNIGEDISDTEEMSTNNKAIGLTAIGGGIIGGLKGVGKVLESAGKRGYELGVGETQAQALQKNKGRTGLQKFLGIKPEGAKLGDVRTTPETALERGGIGKMTGSSSARGITATQTAKRIWRKEIAPIFKNSNTITNIKDITKGAIGAIEKNAGNVFDKVMAKKGVSEVMTALQKSFGKKIDITKMTLQQIQDLKSHLMTMDIPKSAFNGIELKTSYKQGAMALAKQLRDKAVEIAKQENPSLNVDKFKRAFVDYGNLMDLAETSAKKAGINPSQNLQQIISSASGKPVSAATTFLGKTVYKLGKVLQLPYDKTLGLVFSKIKPLLKNSANFTPEALIGDALFNRPELKFKLNGKQIVIPKKHYKDIPEIMMEYLGNKK